MNLQAEGSATTGCGKFFARRGAKFFFKAVRLEPGESRPDLVEIVALREQLGKLSRGHATGLVVRQPGAQALLPLAGQVGLIALVELEVALKELLDPRDLDEAAERIREAVLALRAEPDLCGYLLDCGISPGELRHYGLGRIQRRLGTLVRALKACDPKAIVAVKHRLEVRALWQGDEDFLYCTVPSLAPSELNHFLLALHNLAESRPVVVEFNEPTPIQDELVTAAFGLGAAGVVVVSPPATAPRVGCLRMLACEELSPFFNLNGQCPPAAARQPMVSVVICAYNAERTIGACLESLGRLEYPNYEVIIVDDGSRDQSAAVAMGFPRFRLIRQSNKGLAAARNIGLKAAGGEIVAYIDSDCIVDSHWLTLIVRAIEENDFDGCGGPNYAPHEERRLAACVAASPGAPTPVLTAEDRAEHLPGCNLALRKVVLNALGGFDPQFVLAGDDVDICWRALEAGYVLGYSPAAFVWHSRRSTVKGYWRQQFGYGQAEALLYRKYPQCFNALGQIKWDGTVLGVAATLPSLGGRRVLWRPASAHQQNVFDSPLGIANFLPLSLEWTALGALGLVLAMVGCWPLYPALVMLGFGPLWAFYCAWHAPLEKRHDGVLSRLLVAMLWYSGPVCRAVGRNRMRARLGLRAEAETGLRPRQHPTIDWARRCLHLAYWSDDGTQRDSVLRRLVKLCGRQGWPTVADAGWRDYDLGLRPDPWVRIRIKTADEDYGAGRFRIQVLARIRLSPLARSVLAGASLCAAMFWMAGFSVLSFMVGTMTVAAALWLASDGIEAGRLLYGAVEQCASELRLKPIRTARHETGRASVGLGEAGADSGASRRSRQDFSNQF